MCNRYFFSLITFLVILLQGCTETVDHRGKTPLVQVGDNFLYKEDVTLAIPPGVSKKDSADIADKFIRNWIDDMLLFVKAEGNIPDDAKIDELVKSYRMQLITHTYLEQIVSQEVEGNISDSEIEEFYNKNKNIFLFDPRQCRSAHLCSLLNTGLYLTFDLFIGNQSILL